MCSNPAKWLFFLSSCIHLCHSSVFIFFTALNHLRAFSQTKHGQFCHDIKRHLEFYLLMKSVNRHNECDNIRCKKIFFRECNWFIKSLKVVRSHLMEKSDSCFIATEKCPLLFFLSFFLCSFLIGEVRLPLYAV